MYIYIYIRGREVYLHYSLGLGVSIWFVSCLLVAACHNYAKCVVQRHVAIRPFSGFVLILTLPRGLQLFVPTSRCWFCDALG